MHVQQTTSPVLLKNFKGHEIQGKTEKLSDAMGDPGWNPGKNW